MGPLTAITLGAFLYVATSPSAYRSDALLLLRPADAGAAPVTGKDIRTEVELLQSRDLLAQAARAAGLIAPGNTTASDRDNTLARIHEALTVSAVPQAALIRLEYTGGNRWEGAQFLHELIRIRQDRYVHPEPGIAGQRDPVRELRDLSARPIIDVILVREPQVPARAEDPHYGIVLAFWSAGMLLSTAAVLAFGRSRRIFYTPGVLESFAGIPVLGTVPLQRRLIG